MILVLVMGINCSQQATLAPRAVQFGPRLYDFSGIITALAALEQTGHQRSLPTEDSVDRWTRVAT